MSLVVMKNKSRRYKAVVSGRGGGGFSIVGGRRNQGWVGQDNLGRHLIRTPFRGNEPIGYGGSDGKYVRSVISDAGFCCTNDPTIIKRSTMTTSGLLATSVKYPTGVFNEDCDKGRCSGEWVKDFNPMNHGQSSRIEKIKIRYTTCAGADGVGADGVGAGGESAGAKSDVDCKCRNKTYFIGGVRHIVTPYAKPPQHTGARDASEYIDSGLMKKNCLPTPDNKKAFPFVINHIGCDVNYVTPEEAIWSGELPEDWMTNTAETDVIFSVNPYL